MIEAVSSVVSNAPFSRSEAERVNASLYKDTSNQDVSSVPEAEDVSTILTTFDTEYSTPVTQILNPQSGQVLLQFPSETHLKTRELLDQQQVDPASVAASANVSSEPVSRPVESSEVLSAFDVFDSSQAEPSINGSAQAQIAAQALNEAAQSGVSALSVLTVQA